MYYLIIILLMAVCPAVSIYVEHWVLHSPASLLSLSGKWFVFWPVGIRLMLAGLRQIFNPAFTAKTIFAIEDHASFDIVQELGFANVAIALIGILALFNPGWVMPAAIAGGLFYGLAGLKHVMSKDRNALRNTAMASDIWIFVILAIYIAMASLHTAS